jgi:hypothetical protein
MNSHSLQRALASAAILIAAFATLPASARTQYVKCKDAQGRVTMQNVPCAVDSRTPRPPGPVVGTKAPRGRDDMAGSNWDPKRQQLPPMRSSVPEQPRETVARSGPARSVDQSKVGRGEGGEGGQGQKEREFQARKAAREAEERAEYNRQVMARNKASDCDHARQQLGVANGGGAVYRHNNKGERVFVEEANRAAEVASAERRVATACQ